MGSPAGFLPLVGYPATIHAGLDFYFSLGTLVVGIVGGITLFVEWWLHRHTSLLFWSLGFFAIYWFQVPAILANAGFSFVVTSFNLFYAVSFPLGFFGLVLIYLGIRTILPPANPGMARRLNGANPFDYLTELQKHAKEMTRDPAAWMPWNYGQTLAHFVAGAESAQPSPA